MFFCFFEPKEKKKKKKEATDLVGWLVERDVAQDSQRESIQGRPNQISPPIAANRGYSTWCIACNRNKRPSAHKTTEIISQFCYHSRSASFDSGMPTAQFGPNNTSPTSKFVFDHVFFFQFISKRKLISSAQRIFANQSKSKKIAFQFKKKKKVNRRCHISGLFYLGTCNDP